MAELSTKSKIALAKAARKVIMAGRRLLGGSGHAQVDRGGIQWDLDLSEGIDFAIYLLGGFELRTLKLYQKLVVPGSVVLDIGANIGAHTLPLAQLVGPAGRVIAFEPTEFAFGKLRRNLGLNPALCDRVHLMQVALLARLDDQLPEAIYSSWPLDRHEEIHESHGGLLQTTRGAKVSTVDAVVESMSLESVDFVKLDVDGHEPAVVFGAAHTLEKFKPTIVMEWAPSCFDSAIEMGQQALESLARIGYRFSLQGTGELRPLTREALGGVVASGASVNLVLQCGVR